MARYGDLDEHGLTVQQRIAVKELLQGKTYRETAALLQVNERTLWRWRKMPGFQKAFKQGLSENFDRPGAQGVSLLPDVIKTLKEIVQNPLSSDSDKISASRVLITSAHEYQIRKNLEHQIFELEQRLIKLANFQLGQRQPNPDNIAMAQELFDNDNAAGAPQLPAAAQQQPPEDNYDAVEVSDEDAIEEALHVLDELGDIPAGQEELPDPRTMPRMPRTIAEAAAPPPPPAPKPRGNAVPGSYGHHPAAARRDNGTARKPPEIVTVAPAPQRAHFTERDVVNGIPRKVAAAAAVAPALAASLPAPQQPPAAAARPPESGNPVGDFLDGLREA